jgi:hypothetical protein
MKRATFVLGVLVLLTVAWAAPVAAASFKAVIHETFQRRASAEPCVAVEGGATCPGSGTVQGYGNVVSSIFFPDTEGPLVRTLTFSDGSTLILHETYIGSRFPGKAFEAPGALVSYGNPAFDHFAWQVAGGTGTFAGATGAGEWNNVLAGDTIVLKFEGTLNLR